MKELRARLEQAAQSQQIVHISGETGTGKEQVARALHEASPRRHRPFVPVNCAALTEELFDSRLFGHVRGAFTGALSDRPGLVTAAEGGTLFLDEVSELRLQGQARLLRFLQDREFHRVGDTQLRRADVRVVTAANVSLRRRVAEGRFREDLEYRLGCLELALPPLRERGADVVALARHFLDRAARAENRNGLRLSVEAEQALREHAWPGNVRELERLMNRMAVFARGSQVSVADLGPQFAGSPAVAGGSLREELRRFERRLLARTLEAHAGNRTHAARALGITRQALLDKLRRLGLRTPPGLLPA